MPKIKKPRTAAALTAKTVRHEPLGQTIQNDENRQKYASSRKSRRRGRGEDAEESFLDEKTSERILKLSKEQRLEMEAEERRQARNATNTAMDKIVDDSDDDEEEEEEPHASSILDEEQE